MDSRIALSRRTFIAAAVAAGCAVGGSRPASAASIGRVPGANEVLRVGVLGCGSRGAFLMRALARRRHSSPPVRIAAVCDVHESRAGRARDLTRAEVVPEWQALVARRDIDAVLIATPDHQHASMAIAAMESGKDVYCETPMARTLEEGKTFMDCARRTGRVVQIGAWEASEASWQAAREAVRAGRIGRPVWCHSDCCRSVAPGAAAEPGAVAWRAFLGQSPARLFDADRFLRWPAYWDYCDGVTAQDFYPKLAALLSVLGPAFPSRVSAAGGVHARDGRETPDRLVMTCVYPGGATVVLSSSARGVGTVIRGERGDLEVEEGEGIAESARPDHLDDWLTCIRTRGTCACPVQTGYQTLVATCMAVEAYRKGETLRFDA